MTTVTSLDSPSTTNELDAEARLLLCLAKARVGSTEIDQARAIIGDGLRWGVFLERAARHKVLPLVGRHIAEHGLSRGETGDGTQGIPFAWIYPTVYAGNRERNRALADEAMVVTRALERAGIAYAMRKGLALAETHYRDLGARRINDIDLLVARDNADAADTVLRELGFVQGKLAPTNDRIEPFSRATQIFWRTNLTNQLPYVKLGARVDLPVVNIDLCHALFQKNVATGDDTATVLGRATTTALAGGIIRRLEPADEIIDLCAHLYKEATGLMFVEQGIDLQISKFLDVAVAAASLSDREWRLVTERTSPEQQRVVFYALHHAGVLYPESVPETVLDGLRPENTDYLDVFGGNDGNPITWNVPFPERLFVETVPTEGTVSNVPHR